MSGIPFDVVVSLRVLCIDCVMHPIGISSCFELSLIVDEGSRDIRGFSNARKKGLKRSVESTVVVYADVVMKRMDKVRTAW
jgi:hypothetical protein